MIRGRVQSSVKLLKTELFTVIGWFGQLTNGPPKGVHVLIPGTCECYLMWQRMHCKCDLITGFEMGRLSWII